ncbi:MAG: hypothetical protein K6F17_00565 [Lachnospiraceae bacterium]|nr:hypothetical protein [Lachnospiraceae bacterium]
MFQRELVNLVYLRILGEKEYCEFYRYEGLVFWLINIVDSYIELYDYTVEVVQRIVKEAENLNITVPEKMRKVRL